MPNRPASQPVSGVMIAAATMYDVTTHAIWSCEQLKLPWICGSATLAMVVSTPCMIVAQVIEAVIAARLIRGAPIPSPDSLPWAVAAPRNDRRLRIRRASSATAAELATAAGAPVICAGMFLSRMPYTKAALLVFVAGAVLGLAVVTVRLPG